MTLFVKGGHMSEQEIEEGKIVIASAGLLIYRKVDGAVEVLTAQRQNKPWEGYTTVDFSGLVKKSDRTVKDAAIREGGEETGGTLNFIIKHLIGIYGPQRFWHELKRRGSDLAAVATAAPISNKYFVATFFAAEVISGEPTANREMQDFRFVSPLALADEGAKLNFDGALVLADFWWKIRYDPSWLDPRVTRWIYGSFD